jgi:hypothetical protein
MRSYFEKLIERETIVQSELEFDGQCKNYNFLKLLARGTPFERGVTELEFNAHCILHEKRKHDFTWSGGQWKRYLQMDKITADFREVITLKIPIPVLLMPQITALNDAYFDGI